MASKTSTLRRTLKSYQIYGANTNIGKTIMSTILCKAFARNHPTEQTWYLKPVSTGPLDEADDRHISRFAPETHTKCLFQFDEAVSPHIAARSSMVCSPFQKSTSSRLITCSPYPTPPSSNKFSLTLPPAPIPAQVLSSLKQLGVFIRLPQAGRLKQIFTVLSVSQSV